MSKVLEHQKALVSEIITLLEGGVSPWQSDFIQGHGLPLRSCGKSYQGINIIRLWATALKQGFTSPYWMTYRQAKTLGAQVRKGEKSTVVFYYGQAKKEDDNGEEKAFRFLRFYRVFNASQIDGLGEEYQPQPAERDDSANENAHDLTRYLLSLGADVHITPKPQACYVPAYDKIIMAGPDVCKSERHFAATFAHEHIHWTGHQSRCERDLTGEHGSPKYAYEELIAELGAAFLCARFGLKSEHIDNHAAYIAHWLDALKKDPKVLFKAAGQASAALTFMDGLHQLQTVEIAA